VIFRQKFDFLRFDEIQSCVAEFYGRRKKILSGQSLFGAVFVWGAQIETRGNDDFHIENDIL